MSLHSSLKLNYIGSKRTLLPLYAPIFDRYLTPTSTFADLFCGTGVVSSFVQARYPTIKLVVNDLQRYATTVTAARLASYTREEVAALRIHMTAMNELRSNGFFATHYADKYFSRENCERLDGCRRYLETTALDTKLYTFLLAALVSSADAVANTAAVYGAYLKKVKASALAPLHLAQLPLADTPPSTVTVTTSDICKLETEVVFDVLYLDPPYNARQYGSNYHVLETIVKYDEPELKGVTLLPPYPKSTFCSKARDNAFVALKTVVDRFHWKVLMLSYSSDGIIPLESIVELLLGKGKVILYEVQYKRFQSQAKATGKEVTEYLVVCEAGAVTERAEEARLE